MVGHPSHHQKLSQQRKIKLGTGSDGCPTKENCHLELLARGTISSPAEKKQSGPVEQRRRKNLIFQWLEVTVIYDGVEHSDF